MAKGQGGGSCEGRQAPRIARAQTCVPWRSRRHNIDTLFQRAAPKLNLIVDVVQNLEAAKVAGIVGFMILKGFPTLTFAQLGM